MEQPDPTLENVAQAGENPVSPLDEAHLKLKEAEQRYLYLYSDFENYKKRSIKERQDSQKFAIEGFAEELLPVLDNFERALQFAKVDGDPSLVEGIKMVANQLRGALEKYGVVTITAIDQAFNPELHEAVGQSPSPKPAGTIIQELQKGYTIQGRLLRPSKVMLSSGN